ncbi:hypothetical protein PG996_011153 [Apiospora saccharicola]|uniref:Uncharacterized protein n=1 Tax=Apiospora saccharicola TaxID=335842 RepID=A0ABR1UGI8_9PEZI
MRSFLMQKMSEDQTTREPQERPRSFGIGGAGNIRTRADATLTEIAPASPDKKEEPRRRSSVFSSSSSAEGERRQSKLLDNMKGIFRRSSTKESEQEDDK